jgi:hypothetical protein
MSLKQVQRDFLSQSFRRRTSTPSECDTSQGVATELSNKKGEGPRPAHLHQSNTGVSTPSTLCSFGLVVVYWRWMRLSGKMIGAAPKAASAAS